MPASAAAKGIMTHKKTSLLRENGRHITLTKDWADSCRKRHHFVKQKVTKAVRKLPEDFEEQRTSCLERIRDLVEEHAIPPVVTMGSLVGSWNPMDVEEI